MGIVWVDRGVVGSKSLSSTLNITATVARAQSGKAQAFEAQLMIPRMLTVRKHKYNTTITMDHPYLPISGAQVAYFWSEQILAFRQTRWANKYGEEIQWAIKCYGS